MKKLSWKQRWWHKRRCVQLLTLPKARRLPRGNGGKRSVGSTRLDRTFGLVKTGVLKASVSGANVTITMPEAINFHKNYDESIAPILAIREVVNQQRLGFEHGYRLGYIDFDNIRSLSTSASLVLAAEVDIWRRKALKKLSSNASNWDQNIRDQLCDLGFFDLLKLTNPPRDSAKSSRRNILKYLCGGPSDVNLAKQLRIDIESLVGTAVKKLELFQGLSEAITNVSQHAYPTPQDNYRLWWMTASFKPNSRQLKVVFYDRGISIPGSLPASGLWESARHYLSTLGLHPDDDMNLLQAAMEMGRTGTGLRHRGKGLQDLLYFIRSYGKGFLSILSRHGSYKFSMDGDETVELKRLAYEMPGTLIVWSVCLPHDGADSRGYQ